MNLRPFAAGLLALTLFTGTGCDKDSDKDDNGQSERMRNITSGAWKISSATVLGTDVTGEVPACYLDNLVSFDSDFTGDVNESANVCNPSRAGEFAWSFNEAESEITVSGDILPTDDDTFTIESLTSTTLIVSQPTNLIPVPNAMIIVTFVHN